jgi:hypothetical protein
MWDRASVDAASLPAPAAGKHTGRNPTDRGKLGCKHHLLADQRGLLLVPSSQLRRSRSASFHSWNQSQPLKGYRNMRADAQESYTLMCISLTGTSGLAAPADISARIARYGVDSRPRLGRWRWVVARTFGCFTASDDFASGISDGQTFITSTFHVPARPSVGGMSKGLVRRTKSARCRK